MSASICADRVDPVSQAVGTAGPRWPPGGWPGASAACCAHGVTTRCEALLTSIQAHPPDRLYLMAFVSRFTRHWCSRSASAAQWIDAGSTRHAGRSVTPSSSRHSPAAGPKPPHLSQRSHLKLYKLCSATATVLCVVSCGGSGSDAPFAEDLYKQTGKPAFVGDFEISNLTMTLFVEHGNYSGASVATARSARCASTWSISCPST